MMNSLCILPLDILQELLHDARKYGTSEDFIKLVEEAIYVKEMEKKIRKIY